MVCAYLTIRTFHLSSNALISIHQQDQDQDQDQQESQHTGGCVLCEKYQFVLDIDDDAFVDDDSYDQYSD